MYVKTCLRTFGDFSEILFIFGRVSSSVLPLSTSIYDINDTLNVVLFPLGKFI